MNFWSRGSDVAPGQQGAVVPAPDDRDAPVSRRDENPGLSGPEEDELDVGVVVDGDDVVGDRTEVSRRESVARKVGRRQVQGQARAAAVVGT